jgi:acyl dehydratase
MMKYEVSYTVKDLILYALSLGMGSTASDSDELMYLYESHERFSGVPTFYFTSPFWANQSFEICDTNRIPPFPPPIMAKEQVIPKRFLKNIHVNLDQGRFLSHFPVIHTWQSITWHGRGVLIPVDTPHSSAERHYFKDVRVRVDTTTISVQPKSLGTFVTTQTHVSSLHEHQKICTMQSMALVMGISPEKVIPFDAGIFQMSLIRQSAFFSSQDKRNQPSFQWSYQTSHAQALLYRLASGDSNHIHVDASALKHMEREHNVPILHGLFTLSLAYRAIVKLVQSGSMSEKCKCSADDLNIQFRNLEGKFTHPAFVGDCLCVKVWMDSSTLDDTFHPSKCNPVRTTFAFIIVHLGSGKILVDCGLAEVDIYTRSKRVKVSRL